jgi:uncharacterized DUF497 family protein
VVDIFDDPFALYFDDHKHSDYEVRGGVIGRTAEYGLVVVIYASADEGTRFITARRAENWMVRMYEKQRRRH